MVRGAFACLFEFSVLSFDFLMVVRRARGMLLRLVRRRSLAVAVGLALIGPAAWLELSGRYDAWWVDGLGLVLGATGLALLWTGLAGLRPDWIDSD
jgi:hypothetical protein